MNLDHFFWSSIHSTLGNIRSQNWLIIFCSNFCMKLYRHKVRKVWKSKFWSPQRSGGTKKFPKLAKKWDFLVFDKNLINSYVSFLLQYEIINGHLTFCKNWMSGKNLVLEFWSKNLYTNQNAGLKLYNISQTSWWISVCN